MTFVEVRKAQVLPGLLATTILIASPVRAQTTGEDCAWAGPSPVGIGIERIRCIGGECEINVTAADGGLEHRFSTEPRIDRLRASAPRAIREGDIIASVDGLPITTGGGGRRLARLKAERDVTLGLRRGDRYFEVRLRPQPGCPIGGLAVRWASHGD